MNKDEREILEQFRELFNEDAEKISLPGSLSRENITARLMQTEQENVVPLRKSKASAGRRIAAAAACFVLLLAVAVVARNAFGGSNIGIKGAFEGFKIEKLLKQIGSREELDTAVSEIMSDTDTSAPRTDGRTEGESGKPEAASPVAVDGAVNTGSVVNDTSKQADIVKYHRGYLYILTSSENENTSLPEQSIKIISVSPGGEMKEAACITPGGNESAGSSSECFEISVSGNTLTALVRDTDYPADAGFSAKHTVRAQFFDISDPENPVIKSTLIQDGSFVSSSLEGGTFYLVTSDALSGENVSPAVEINGKKQPLDAQAGEITAAENAKEKAYLLITASKITDGGIETAKAELLGCSASCEIYTAKGGVYITRQFSSVETDEKRTEIYFISSAETGLKLAGTYSFDGALSARLNISERGISYIYSRDGGLYSGTLGTGLKKETEDTDLELPGDSAVRFIGKTAYVSGSDGVRKITFSDSGVSVEDSGIRFGEADIYRLTANRIIEIGKPGTDGKSNILLYDSDGGVLSSYTLEAADTVPIVNSPLAVLIDEENSIFGIPVIVTDSRGEKSAYILFDASSGEIKPVGMFTHNSFSGDAATRAVAANGMLFTVSGEKIMAFSIAGGKAVRAYAY